MVDVLSSTLEGIIVVNLITDMSAVPVACSGELCTHDFFTLKISRDIIIVDTLF